MGKKDDVPNAASLLLPLHSPCDGHSAVHGSPRVTSCCVDAQLHVNPCAAQCVRHPSLGSIDHIAFVEKINQEPGQK